VSLTTRECVCDVAVHHLLPLLLLLLLLLTREREREKISLL
jgi:hypothetical protein